MAAATLDDWKGMYRTLWRIRSFEGQVQRLAALGEVPGFPHLSTGQEAVAVGVCAHLSREDPLFTSHRGHGHVLAKGSDLEATFAEILGRRNGLCRGRGGPMHLVDAAHGVLGATGVVGGDLALAAGAAWAAQAQGGQQHQCCLLRRRRHGRRRVPANHEPRGAVAAAGAVRLREQWLRRVHEPGRTLRRQAGQQVRRALRHAAQTIDGNDLPAVYAGAGEAIECLRRGAGPYLLKCVTFRMAGHYVGDSQATGRRKSWPRCRRNARSSD